MRQLNLHIPSASNDTCLHSPLLSEASLHPSISCHISRTLSNSLISSQTIRNPRDQLNAVCVDGFSERRLPSKISSTTFSTDTSLRCVYILLDIVQQQKHRYVCMCYYILHSHRTHLIGVARIEYVAVELDIDVAC